MQEPGGAGGAIRRERRSIRGDVARRTPYDRPALAAPPAETSSAAAQSQQPPVQERPSSSERRSLLRKGLAWAVKPFQAFSQQASQPSDAPEEGVNPGASDAPSSQSQPCELNPAVQVTVVDGTRGGDVCQLSTPTGSSRQPDVANGPDRATPAPQENDRLTAILSSVKKRFEDAPIDRRPGIESPLPFHGGRRAAYAAEAPKLGNPAQELQFAAATPVPQPAEAPSLSRRNSLDGQPLSTSQLRPLNLGQARFGQRSTGGNSPVVGGRPSLANGLSLVEPVSKPAGSLPKLRPHSGGRARLSDVGPSRFAQAPATATGMRKPAWGPSGFSHVPMHALPLSRGLRAPPQAASQAAPQLGPPPARATSSSAQPAADHQPGTMSWTPMRTFPGLLNRAGMSGSKRRTSDASHLNPRRVRQRSEVEPQTLEPRLQHAGQTPFHPSRMVSLSQSPDTPSAASSQPSPGKKESPMTDTARRIMQALDKVSARPSTPPAGVLPALPPPPPPSDSIHTDDGVLSLPPPVPLPMQSTAATFSFSSRPAIEFDTKKSKRDERETAQIPIGLAANAKRPASPMLQVPEPSTASFSFQQASQFHPSLPTPTLTKSPEPRAPEAAATTRVFTFRSPSTDYSRLPAPHLNEPSIPRPVFTFAEKRTLPEAGNPFPTFNFGKQEASAAATSSERIAQDRSEEAAAVGLPSDTDDDADVPGPIGSKEDTAAQEAPKPFAGGWGAAFLIDHKQANQKASEESTGAGAQSSMHTPQENGDAPKATGGWGAEFLAKNKAINVDCTAAIEKVITEENAGNAPTGGAEASSTPTFSFGVTAPESGPTSQAPLAAGIFTFGGADASKAGSSEAAPLVQSFGFRVPAVSEAATSEAAPAAHPFSFGAPAASTAPMSKPSLPSQAISFGMPAESKAAVSDTAPIAMPVSFGFPAASTAELSSANETPTFKPQAAGQPSGLLDFLSKTVPHDTSAGNPSDQGMKSAAAAALTSTSSAPAITTALQLQPPASSGAAAVAGTPAATVDSPAIAPAPIETRATSTNSSERAMSISPSVGGSFKGTVFTEPSASAEVATAESAPATVSSFTSSWGAASQPGISFGAATPPTAAGTKSTGFGMMPNPFGTTAPAAPATSAPHIAFGGAAQQSASAPASGGPFTFGCSAAQQSASAPASGGPFAFGSSTASTFAAGTSSNIGSFGNTMPSLANGSAPSFTSMPGQGGLSGLQGVSANGGSVTAPSMTGGSTGLANGGFGNAFNVGGQTGSAPGQLFGGGFGGMAQGQAPAGNWGQMGAPTTPAVGFGGGGMQQQAGFGMQNGNTAGAFGSMSSIPALQGGGNSAPFGQPGTAPVFGSQGAPAFGAVPQGGAGMTLGAATDSGAPKARRTVKAKRPGRK